MPPKTHYTRRASAAKGAGQLLIGVAGAILSAIVLRVLGPLARNLFWRFALHALKQFVLPVRAAEVFVEEKNHPGLYLFFMLNVGGFCIWLNTFAVVFIGTLTYFCEQGISNRASTAVLFGVNVFLLYLCLISGMNVAGLAFRFVVPTTKRVEAELEKEPSPAKTHKPEGSPKDASHEADGKT